MSTNQHLRSESPAKIFISYRREDTQQIAGRLFDRLADTFGERFVLKDVDSIPYGVDFRDYSTRLVQESRIVLALIGPVWLQRQTNGTRRIDDEADLVRLEIEASLRHCAAVIPVLIGDAEPPKAADLPASIASLAYRNAARLRHDPDFRVDSDRLIRRLREILAEPFPTVAGASTLAAASEIVPTAASAASFETSAPGRGEVAPEEASSVVSPIAATPDAGVADPPTHRRELISSEPIASAISEASLPASRLSLADASSPPIQGTTVAAAWLSSAKMIAVLAAASLLVLLFCVVSIVESPLFVSPAGPAPSTMSPEVTEASTADPGPEAGSASTASNLGSQGAATTEDDMPADESASLVDRIVGHFSPGDAAPAPGNGTRAGEVKAFGDPPIEFCWCPAGSFRMGSPEDDLAADNYEKPQVDVTLTQGFWIGRTEVTRGQWAAVMGSEPWKSLPADPGPESDDVPITYISWDEAQEFCTILSSRERGQSRLLGWTYALPTEAQWEYACRAGTTTRYSFKGDDARLADCAWAGEGASRTYPHPVGSKLINPWCLFDMHGNVEEWCRDATESVIHASPGGEDPYRAEGTNRIVRGGSWADHASDVTSAQRDKKNPHESSLFVGFRLVCVPSE